MLTETRLSVADIDALARTHTPAFTLFERAQIESMRESLSEYGLALSSRDAALRAAMHRLNRVVELHDKARAEGNYALADSLREALDVGSGPEVRDAPQRYGQRFDVANKKRLVHFLATPPR